MSALGMLSPSLRLPMKPRPPTTTMGVWFTSNCMHAEIVDHVDEAAKRPLVDKETYTRWHYSAIGRILAKSTLLQKIWAGCPLSEVILYSGRSFGGKRFVIVRSREVVRYSEVPNVLFLW